MSLQAILVIGGGTIFFGACMVLPLNAIMIGVMNNTSTNVLSTIPSYLIDSSYAFNIGLLVTSAIVISAVIAMGAYAMFSHNNFKGLFIGTLSAVTCAAVMCASTAIFYAGVIENNISCMAIQHQASFVVFRSIIHSDIIQETELIASYGGIVAAAVISSLIAIACTIGIIYAAVN